MRQWLPPGRAPRPLHTSRRAGRSGTAAAPARRPARCRPSCGPSRGPPWRGGRRPPSQLQLQQPGAHALAARDQVFLQLLEFPDSGPHKLELALDVGLRLLEQAPPLAWVVGLLELAADVRTGALGLGELAHL